MSKEKRIAALVPNILGVSPGQRVRIEMWEKYLNAAGWRVEYFPFEDELLHKVFYKQGNAAAKISGLIRCYQKQLKVIQNKFSADVVFIYREASLVGPAILERKMAKQGLPIIYDVDDPIFLPYRSPVNGWRSLLKFSRKTHDIFRLSSRIIAINDLIGDYAATYNPNVTVVPNCVDTDRVQPQNSRINMDKTARLVFLGSQSTMQNLTEIAQPLKRLQSKYKAPFLIIGAGHADLEGVDFEMRQWSPETELSDLQEGDIGLAPVNDSPWNTWKSSFKMIQYMAVGIPVVARRISSNDEVIEDGVNGFLAETMDEWHDRIEILINNPELRRKMGEAARRTILEKYSLRSQMPRVIEVFENVLKRAD